MVSTPDGDVVDEAAQTLGGQRTMWPSTAGCCSAWAGAALGADEVEVINDSELIAHQVNGRYKVKHADMKPLHAAALEALGQFERWTVRPVPRAENADADALVNQAMDGGRA